MTDQLLHLVDVTDVLSHFLATKELGGIPRLLVTIIDTAAAIPDVEFCVFDKRAEAFFVVGNRSSLDVALLDQYEFSRGPDRLDHWVEHLAPDLRPIDDSLLQGRTPHYCFLSSQWDTLPERENFSYLRDFLQREKVTVLHHDSYFLGEVSVSAAACRFRGYWSVVLESDAKVIFISEHGRHLSERYIGHCARAVIARYDFALSYPRITKGVSAEALELVQMRKPYLLVFAILDGRKSPIALIEAIAAAKLYEAYEIALIVRFACDDKDERIKLITLALTHNLKVFYSPNDATYLWLIRYSHAVFYPSLHEGFGMVPIDCKHFGKICYLPAQADYAYLHSNAISYEQDRGLDIPDVQPNVVSDLKAFPASEFARTLFSADF